MITFKFPEDISKLSPDDPAFPIVKELIKDLIEAYTTPGQPFDHEAYGYVILIEPEDADRTLNELWDGCTLLNIPWEGIMLRDGFFVAIYLANNEYGLVFWALPLIGWVTFISPLPQDKDPVLQGESRLHWQTVFCCGNLCCVP